MSIQPLVENAISHALEQMTDICTIRLTAHRSEENVLITVENNGSCIDVDVLDKLKSNVYEPSGNGIGLINIDSRIKLIFGEQYGLSFRNLDDGVQAIITLPEHYMPANSKTMEVEKCSD
jgi:two-component system sensor histidine kinase YesM